MLDPSHSLSIKFGNFGAGMFSYSIKNFSRCFIRDIRKLRRGVAQSVDEPLSCPPGIDLFGW